MTGAAAGARLPRTPRPGSARLGEAGQTRPGLRPLQAFVGQPGTYTACGAQDTGVARREGASSRPAILHPRPPTLPKARCASLTAGRAPPLRQGVLLARHLVRQVIVHHPPRGCCGWNPARSLMQTGRPSPCTGRAGHHRPLKPERAPPSVPSPTSHLPAARWPAAHSLCPPTPVHVLAGE